MTCHAFAYTITKEAGRDAVAPGGCGRRRIEFGNDSDEDLLAYVAMREDDDDEGARAAFVEFRERHKNWLFVTVRRHHGFKLLGGDEGAADVVQETFIKVWYGADKYDVGGLTGRDEIERRTRSWLSVIARNVVADMLRGPSVRSDPLEEFDHGFPAPEVKNTPPTESERRLREQLEQLSEREKDVVFTSLLYHKPGATQQRLPNEVSRELAERLGTTPPNIRAIRKRAMLKIERAVLDGQPVEES